MKSRQIKKNLQRFTAGKTHTLSIETRRNARKWVNRNLRKNFFKKFRSKGINREDIPYGFKPATIPYKGDPLWTGK